MDQVRVRVRVKPADGSVGAEPVLHHPRGELPVGLRGEGDLDPGQRTRTTTSNLLTLTKVTTSNLAP